MTTDLSARLNEIANELDRQDAEWRRACRALERLGDLTIVVPLTSLEQLDTLAASTLPAADPRGVRG